MNITARVITNLSDVGTAISTAGISDATPKSVGLGGSFSGVTISPLLASRFNLIDASNGNLRIRNRHTQEYEYFSAFGGVVNFTSDMLNEDFFEKFGMPGSPRTITVEAVYINQYAVSVNVIQYNPSRGEVRFEVTDRKGNTTSPATLASHYDDGTTIIIRIQPTEIATIDIGGTVNAGELNAAGNIITIRLTENRSTITIDFTVSEFTISTAVINEVEREIGSIVATSFTGQVFNEGNNIALIEVVTAFNPEAYNFAGWFAVRGGELLSLEAYTDPTDNKIHNLLLSQDFIRDFADGQNFRIVAMLATVYMFNIDSTGSGSFRTVIVTFNETTGEWDEDVATAANGQRSQTFPADTFIRITTTPANLFRLHGIDGLRDFFVGAFGHEIEILDGTSAIIKIDGYREISVNFAPREYTIDFSSSDTGVVINMTSVTLEDVIRITFDPSTGLQISGWLINGKTIENTPGASVSGNTVLIDVNTWLASLSNIEDAEIKLTVKVDTQIHTAFFYGGAGVLAIIGFIALVITMILLNNKRQKMAYAAFKKKEEVLRARLGHANRIQDLREGN